MEHCSFSDDECLFFGSIPVHFALHPGSVHWMDQYSFVESSTTEKLHHPQLELPKMPTTSIHIEKKSNADENGDRTREIFHQPLIKTAEHSRLTGLASGIRSALIKGSSSTWYRLKGCGNQNDGFLIEPLPTAEGTWTIRGCAFLHTIYRELYMTELISQLFHPHRIQCANRSLGWFEYHLSTSDQSRDTAKDIPTMIDPQLHRWPDITRGCIVMETLANKRLSDHVLYGLEQCFDSIIVHSNAELIDLSKLLETFPSHRFDGSTPLPTWLVSLDADLGPLANVQSNWLTASAHLSSDLHLDIDQRWKTLWTTSVQTLHRFLAQHSLSDLLHLIYRRFGYECGAILGLMHYHRISWGTYTDGLGTHCNAHLNNLVLKFPSSTNVDGREFFLAPLDFDMSFTESSCSQPFDELMTMELQGFRLGLGGDSKANSGMAAWIEMPNASWTTARWYLRDLMLREFDLIYSDVVQTGTIQPFEILSHEQIRSIYALLRLALIRTMNEIS